MSVEGRVSRGERGMVINELKVLGFSVQVSASEVFPDTRNLTPETQLRNLTPET